MNWSIGLTGLEVAQRAISLVGTNISNAATEGYHRQDLRLAPVAFGETMQEPLGVEVVDIQRAADALLEAEIVGQQPQHGQVERELTTLKTLESVFGELDAEGLGTALDTFFGALRELSAQPNSQPLQNQAVWAAHSLTTEFRRVGRFIEGLRRQVAVEARNRVEDVNTLAAEIASLNSEIHTMNVRGGNPNVLLDKRDQALADLGKLIEMEVSYDGSYEGSVSVLSVGTPLAISTITTELDVAITSGDKLGVAARGAGNYSTSCDGGKLGGLFALYNEIIPNVQNQLDTLASTLATEINKLHAQGVGARGAFTDLTGVPSAAEAFSEWNAGIQDGSFHLRVTNESTGKIVRHKIDVTTGQTLSDVAAALDGLTDADGDAALTARVTAGALRIESVDDQTFTFDFLPAPLADISGGWTGTSEPVASGVYTGESNDTLTVTVDGDGTVGTGDLSLEVRNGAGELLDTVNIGSGYAPGDPINIGNGLYVSMPVGTVTDTESFSILALAETDTSGLLAAAGMNTLFSGNSATTLGVRQALQDDPARLAVASSGDMTDNINVHRMADLSETTLTALGDLTPSDAYREMVTGVGQSVAVRESRLEGMEAVMRQLEQRRDEIGGVDVNEEAAKLLVYEQMFQGVAKFMNTQKDALDMLAQLL